LDKNVSKTMQAQKPNSYLTKNEFNSMKRSIFEGFLSYCPEIILLLYDAYIYADIRAVRLAFKDIEGIDWFHSIFWVQGLKRNTRKSLGKNIYSRGYFIFSKHKNWFE